MTKVKLRLPNQNQVRRKKSTKKSWLDGFTHYHKRVPGTEIGPSVKEEKTGDEEIKKQQDFSETINPETIHKLRGEKTKNVNKKRLGKLMKLYDILFTERNRYNKRRDFYLAQKAVRENFED